MQAKLVIVSGKANKRDVLLKLPTVIGRSREADLTVAHPMVSRKHCELFEVDGLLKIRDLGSLNGTLVAGERIKETELRPEDEFTVGPLTFRVEYDYAGEIAAAPTAGGVAEEVPDFQILGDEENLPETEPAAPLPEEPVVLEEPADMDKLGDLDGQEDLNDPSDLSGGWLDPVADEEPLDADADEPPLPESATDDEPPLLTVPADEKAEEDEAALEPDFEAWDEPQTQVTDDLLGDEVPLLQPVQPQDNAQAAGPKAADSPVPPTPAAKAKQPAGAASAANKDKPTAPAAKKEQENKEKRAVVPSSKAPVAPGAGQPKKVDKLPDFLAGLSPGPEAQEEEEEQKELSPEDQALNDFLKGLS